MIWHYFSETHIYVVKVDFLYNKRIFAYFFIDPLEFKCELPWKVKVLLGCF